MNNAYKYITEKTKQKMENIEIVTPSIYGVLFADSAKELKLDLDVEELSSSESIDQQVAVHTQRLSDSASKAVNAIKEEDAITLQQVLAETEALREEIEMLKHSMHSDTLTKAYNRQWLEDNYYDEDGKGFTQKGSLAIVDMNDFKLINDTYGHISGDKVLKYVAQRLSQSGGNVVRYGGDEFFVLFDGKMSLLDVTHKMHTVRETVIKKSLKVDGNTFKISFSYAVLSFEEGDDIEICINDVDKQMYNDKIKIKERLKK
ncbi:MAG: diguanylate cyclase [Helicobacteraceae bacterium]|nr:diguanylate cyclase [Helicobacteraceae bacterium]